MPQTEGRPKVSVVRCQSYRREAVKSAVSECIDALGGTSRFVSNGEKILLKPNMLSAKAPDELVTTHPEIVRAMIELVREAGGTPVVGDTPAGRATARTLKNLAEATGIGKVCREEGVEFILMLEAEKFPHPTGRVAKSFELASVLKEVDGVISLAKLKTHNFTTLTCAVKNLFGLIPGLRKVEYHIRMQTPEAFSEMLVDLAECVKPRLTVVDAVVGMDGDGPAAGDPVELGMIIAGDNPHAIDAFALDLVRADPECVWTVNIARKRGLVPTDPSGIEILGGPIAALRPKGFRMPAGTSFRGRITSSLGKVAGTAAARKPVFSKSICSLCGACIDACPAKALKRGKKKPAINRNLCIRCYCCQEMCLNNAITLKRVPARSIGAAVISPLKDRMKGLRNTSKE